MGISLTPQEQFEIFGTDKLEEYTEEARQRWGSTGADRGQGGDAAEER
jgi:MerR family transcriptional regulator, thiopeptide resistance regulator